MELGNSLSLLLETYLPPEFPDTVIQLFAKDVLFLLSSPYKNKQQLSKLIENFQSKIPVTLRHRNTLPKLLSSLEPLFSMSNEQEMLNYVNELQMEYSDNPNDQFILNRLNISPYDGNLNMGRPGSQYSESFENLDRYSERSMLSSQAYNNIGKSPNRLPLRSLLEPYMKNMIDEQEIMKSIPFVLLGTTSELFDIEYDKIIIPSNIPNSESGILHLIFEAGLLYKELGNLCDKYRRMPISPMKKAFIIAVGSELNTYNGLINQLASNDKISTNNGVYVSIYDSINKLRVFYSIMLKFEGLTGDQLLSLLEQLRHHGDLTIENIADKLFSTLLTLYYDYLSQWLTLGSIDNTNNELFIEVEQENTDGEAIFKLNTDKIPSFLTYMQARQIFVIGKSYIFVQKYCKELEYSNEFSNRYKQIYDGLRKNGISIEFIEAVNTQFKEIVSYIDTIICTKFHYHDVLKTLRNILLMGRGDLINTLITKLSSALTSSSDLLSDYSLTRILQESVQQSSLRSLINRGDNNYIINKLDARLLDLGHGAIGWDVFTLDFIVDRPLSFVLNVNRTNGRKEYLRIFNFLWKLKKNQFYFEKESKRTKEILRTFRKFPEFSPVMGDITKHISKCSILLTQLQIFHTKLDNYYLQYVINERYLDLENELSVIFDKEKTDNIKVKINKHGEKRVNGVLKPDINILNEGRKHLGNQNLRDIEQLDNTHNQFLGRILAHKLLSTNSGNNLGERSNKPYPATVIVILNSIAEFLVKYNELNEISYKIYMQLSLEHHPEISVHLQSLVHTIKLLSKQYSHCKEQISTLCDDLRADGDEELMRLSRHLR
ncbi:hypothetical protein B1J92_L04136g [Nakaseomyces glabratus]|nr:hypothetical protein B1J91_L04136g [Nakaseomyces glabratus]OXB46329.1 hypothetical protein B1J92_L04136g [Nakaseomyces glabratus]